MPRLTAESSTPIIPSDIKRLLQTQKLAVLATHRQGLPHLSLVAFATARAGRELLFATTRTSRKFANLQTDGRAAMLLDSRTNQEADFHLGQALTATGTVTECADSDRSAWLELFLGKHPHLQEFVHSPSCALMSMQVQVYTLVSRFQEVMEYRLTS